MKRGRPRRQEQLFIPGTEPIRKPAVPSGLEQYIKDTPDFVTQVAHGGTKRATFRIAEALKAIPPTKCLIFTVIEFQEIFKCTGSIKIKLQSIRNYLRAAGVKHPKVVEDDGRIYVTRTEV